ncbi:hypothetical protein AUK40_05610 [Candidatus Wirthbacteria bacterium CG2_30_54_11]|uniref:AAA domain-containing protein n=1 Tax=Candidatus Wirthbacteria bacterium CG2_30_54_11 TaxID=1817892 RepID=A0A1J5IFQ5_9BACT|nr:MAG: hypothetical protein AUK40_05610 [Candidatus Wirthbacteria bacterium CG2_30_54_11]
MLEVFIKTHLQIAPYYTKLSRRYLYEEINWEARAIAILGARGTGKSTILFQYQKEKYDDPERCLYVLGDDADLLRVTLPVLVQEFWSRGGQVLLIDEIHKYPNWSQVLKNIYDKYPGLKIVISGSSQLDIKREKYDLSRRLVTYTLRGLSLREFINWQTGTVFAPVSLEEILSGHLPLSRQITEQISERTKDRILQLFTQYLTYGYYPYYMESIPDFPSKLRNAVDKVIYEDISLLGDLQGASTIVIKKMLALIGSSHPFEVNISSMANSLQVSRKSIYTFLEYLLDAELLIESRPAGTGNKAARKPSKLYLQNPNLYEVIGQVLDFEAKRGTIREVFALDQLISRHRTTVPGAGDFLVDDRYTVEVGGATKDLRQISGAEDSYAFCDDMESGYERRIPLYLLGFLY